MLLVLKGVVKGKQCALLCFRPFLQGLALLLPRRKEINSHVNFARIPCIVRW